MIGVRVVKDDRVATSYSESLATESLDLMLNNALESAKYAKVDPKQKITVIDSQLTADYPELNQACDATVDDKIALSLRLEQGVVSRPHASSSPYNGYSDVTSQLLIANTQGSLCQQTERYHSAYAYTLFEKDGKQSMAGAMSLGRRYIDLDPEYCIDAGYEQARDLLDGAPVKTGNYSVLFTIDTLSELFGAFSACFSASSAMKGFNPLRDKIGAAIASPLLTVSSQAYVEGVFVSTVLIAKARRRKIWSLLAQASFILCCTIATPPPTLASPIQAMPLVDQRELRSFGSSHGDWLG